MQRLNPSKALSRPIFIFSMLVILATLAVLRFSAHPGPWLIGLTSSIVLFAAVVGQFADPSAGGKD